MDMATSPCEMIRTNNGRPCATVTGFVTSVDQVKKQFTIHVVQKVLAREFTTHINVVACMDCSSRARHHEGTLPKIGDFISFMGSILFFEDDVAFVYVDDVGFVLQF